MKPFAMNSSLVCAVSSVFESCSGLSIRPLQGLVFSALLEFLYKWCSSFQRARHSVNPLPHNTAF